MKEELFDDLILERGYEYAQEGAVDHVRKMGHMIYATVHGSNDYHIKITKDKMYCDCPYAKQGSHCKHMAAVLYYLDSHSVMDENKLIDQLNEKQAKDLLKKILRHHPEYLDDLPQPKEKKTVEKGFINNPKVLSARHQILKYIDEHEDIEILLKKFAPYLEDKDVSKSLIDYYSDLDILGAIEFVKNYQTDKLAVRRMYQSYLKDLYLKANDRKNYLKVLWKLTCQEGDIDDYRELKRQYSYAEWQPLKEKLMASLPSYARLDKIYLEEEMYEELLQLVLNTPGLYILEEYYQVLMDYPDQILHKYLIELKPLIGKQDISRYLEEMKQIPNGEQFLKKNHLE